MLVRLRGWCLRIVIRTGRTVRIMIYIASRTGPLPRGAQLICFLVNLTLLAVYHWAKAEDTVDLIQNLISVQLSVCPHSLLNATCMVTRILAAALLSRF